MGQVDSLPKELMVIEQCNSGTQTIQVAWNGGVTPYISGDEESDLFKYYVGYSESSGVLTPHVPISIADNDNDNFHQLCFSTSDKIVKVSMANICPNMTQIYTAKLRLSQKNSIYNRLDQIITS